MIHKLIPVLVFAAVMLTGCSRDYKKGEKFSATGPGDTLQFLLLDQGKGHKIAKKAAKLKYYHEVKGNTCQVQYVSDSATHGSKKVLLLTHVDLPDMDEDMLTGGFINTFSSRQDVIYRIVSEQDFESYFRKVEK